MSEQKSKMSKRKQSIIAGGLITSAGLFFSKFIGLFYVVPFNEIMGGLETGNQAYYGVAFSIYSYLLNIATAGFPFAIATMVAKYTSRGDYQTALLIKKLSSGLMMVIGFIIMVLVLLFVTPLANLALTETGNNVGIMRNVLILISFALFFVPFLSSIRGFYQGLKHMEVYAVSQVLEQVGRIAFLLGVSAFLVYGLNFDRIWAVYVGVISASVAAIVAYIHLKLYDKKRMPEFRKLAEEQSVESNDNKKEIVHELVFVAIPFLLVSILGYSDMIINTMFLNKGLEAFGNTVEEINMISGIINLYVQKLIAIPMILAPGFSGAIIPHITTALTKNNIKLIRKNMRDCIDTVLYIAIPICFCLFIFAKPIIVILFNPKSASELSLIVEIVSWFSIEAFFCTITPVITSIMMAAKLRRIALRNLLIMTIIKVGTSYFFLSNLGYVGLIASTLIAYTVYLSMNIYTLSKSYHVEWKYTFHKLLIIIIGLVGLYGVAMLCNAIGLKGYDVSRFVGIIQLGIAGGCSVLMYVAITYFFQVPQAIFHIDLQTITKKFKRR